MITTIHRIKQDGTKEEFLYNYPDPATMFEIETCLRYMILKHDGMYTFPGFTEMNEALGEAKLDKKKAFNSSFQVTLV